MYKVLFCFFTMIFSNQLFAQSAFQGFFGQVSTGYESNTVSNTAPTVSNSTGSQVFSTSGNAVSNNMPLVLGAGYNWSINPQFLLGLAADYSTLTATTNTITNPSAGYPNKSPSYQVSN